MKKSAIDIEQFSDVVSTIYDCAVDPRCWPGAIEQVARLVGGFQGLILVQDLTSDKARFYVDWNVDPQLAQTYQEKFHADNPLSEHVFQFEAGEPYQILMHMNRQDWLETRLYREFYKPNGWLDSIGVTLLKTPSRLASFAVTCREERGFTGPREIAIMRLLAPHLRKAVSIADLIEMREVTVQTLESSFDALLVPVLFVDGRCGIIHANSTARDLLAKGDPIRSERGTLTAQAADAAQRLEAAIAALGRDAVASESSQVVYLPFADGRPAFAHVLPITSGTARRQIEPRAAAAIFIAPADEGPVLPLQAWASAFGLTAAEVRVLELLVEGKSILEAADELNVAATTARTHLAHVMQKTGSSRQTDLVRTAMQLMSPLRLAKS
jgi:DNA-binding CsgD family transcriptional regulator